MARQQAGESKAPLVIALAFFVLTTLALGVLTYMAYSEMEAVNAAAKEASNKEAAAVKIADIEKGKVLMYKVAIGTASEEDRTNLQNLRQEAKEAVRAEFNQFQADLSNRIAGAIQDVRKQSFVGAKGGDFVEPKNVFVWNWPEQGQLDPAPQKPLIDQMIGFYASQQLAQMEAKEKEAQALAERKNYQAADAELKKLQQQYQDEIKKVPTQIDSRLKQFQAQADKAVKDFEEEKKTYRIELRKHDENIAKLNLEIKRREDEITKLEMLRARLEEQQAAAADHFQYDKPHGKILAKYGDIVDINLGSADNVRAGLTFAVHPSDTPIRGMQSRMRPDGRGGMIVVPKGQIEVIEILGPNLSRARITQESNKIRESILIGDLLYNSAWRKGAPDHVALFGIFDINGDGTDDIVRLARDLNRMGIVVDAYYDLSKKQWVGEITEKTIYAIEGNMPFKNATAVQSDAIRFAQGEIRKAIETARKDALDRGTKLVKMRDFFPRIGYTINLDVPESRIDQAAARYLLNEVGAPAAKDGL